MQFAEPAIIPKEECQANPSAGEMGYGTICAGAEGSGTAVMCPGYTASPWLVSGLIILLCWLVCRPSPTLAWSQVLLPFIQRWWGLRTGLTMLLARFRTDVVN